MKKPILKNDRAAQVLGFLHTHGPLSSRTLLDLISPKIERRCLRRVLGRLSKRQLIERHFDKMFKGSAVFYRLTRDSNRLKDVALLLGCQPSEFKSPHFVFKEVHHNEECALWTEKLKAHFPNADIVRETQFKAEPIVGQVLAHRGDELDLIPDLMLILKNEPTETPFIVAVEVEKNLKTIPRLVAKLQSYAADTHIDGLIYLCDSDTIAETIRHIYKDRIVDNVGRIAYYGSKFFLFGKNAPLRFNSSTEMFSANFEVTNLSMWINTLRQQKFARECGQLSKTQPLRGLHLAQSERQALRA